MILDEYIKSALLKDLRVNYLIQFESDIQDILNFLPYQNQSNNSFIRYNESAIKQLLESFYTPIKNIYSRLYFNLSFFNKIGFFNNNIVAIGANGSGKTSLSNKLKYYMQNNGVVISAQRILLVPNFNIINNPETTLQLLKQWQSFDKTNKNPDQIQYLVQEFEVVLKNLLAENVFLANKFRIEARNNNTITPPISNLDKTLEIWNSLIEHRKMQCDDGMNIKVEYNSSSYGISQMSDGEKVMLFLIAQVLQAPQNGFIIIDEPEMYLHKTVLKKLWDILENQRQDCIFIYLTHDLDFAVSRITAKKIWIKSFTYPENWDIENIPQNDLPESLILELLGSRKNVLFCEGEKGSIDEKIYNILFPEFTITSVGSCFQVINHTKAFNKIQVLTTKAYGLIDKDHHVEDRLKALEQNNIFSFSVAEVENLLLDEDFLKKMALNVMVDGESFISIKDDIINELARNKELQASNFVSNQIDYYFKDSNVKKANTLTDIKSHFDEFNKDVDIDDIYNKRIKEIDEITASKDYSKTISVYNNKGLKIIVNKHLKITDFTDRAIKLLQFDKTTHAFLLKYFPEILKQST